MNHVLDYGKGHYDHRVSRLGRLFDKSDRVIEGKEKTESCPIDASPSRSDRFDCRGLEHSGRQQCVPVEDKFETAISENFGSRLSPEVVAARSDDLMPQSPCELTTHFKSATDRLNRAPPRKLLGTLAGVKWHRREIWCQRRDQLAREP